MAYDFGSNTLGIRNPFRKEGVIESLAGVLLALMGVWPLLQVAGALQQNDMVTAWVNAGLGLLLLVWGLRRAGVGLFKLFRYFVGRSVPTSLAYNRNPSEEDNAKAERNSLVYDAKTLESMLMGRKNSTFAEPNGWLARLIHSLLPKLVFMPYPIRNFVQELGGLMSTALVALTTFALAYFVSISGLVGEAGSLITPVLSLLLMVYLLAGWHRSSRNLRQQSNRNLNVKGAASLARLIAFAILIPVALGFLYQQVPPHQRDDLQLMLSTLGQYDAWGNLALLAAVAAVVIGLSWRLLAERFARVDQHTEVSEFRDNLQESVHPNEIFINIENIILANRRYKEVPNRLYKAFDPQLNEQSQGKGNFKGELLIETQPEYTPINYSGSFKLFRLIATLGAQGLLLAAAGLFYLLVQQGLDVFQLASNLPDRMSRRQGMELLGQLGAESATLLTLVFSALTCYAGGHILSRGTHLFWAELQFNSLLMWMKTEGTFTESKISTGMSIHDSTRSENVVVRSSITPWIITSRITSTTFATSGMLNLEMPRVVMSMHANDNELGTIVDELTGFLRGRENIASIRNESDLGNADVIHQVNQATRASLQVAEGEPRLSLTEQAAARAREETEPTA